MPFWTDLDRERAARKKEGLGSGKNGKKHILCVYVCAYVYISKS